MASRGSGSSGSSKSGSSSGSGSGKGGAKKGGASKSSASGVKSSGPSKRASGKRELIDTGTDKRYVRRDSQGQFNESDDVGRSLSADRRRKAKTTAPKGQGDRGDRKK